MIHDGLNPFDKTLKDFDELFVAKNGQITIEFTNDGGDGPDRTVFFKSENFEILKVEGLDGIPWNQWNCGSKSENIRCNMVRDGTFAWGGKYQITFGKLIL